MTIDPAHLLKLRLIVARFGEMDVMGWWNTNGVLGRSGKAVFSRGFPTSHPLARARIACEVAAARCRSVFAPPGCMTLWNLPAEVEDTVQAAWSGWCREPEPWAAFLKQIDASSSSPLVEAMVALAVIDDATVEAVKSLRRSAEGKAVPLPGTGVPDLETLQLLAAGFAKGERQKPAIPYLRLADA